MSQTASMRGRWLRSAHANTYVLNGSVVGTVDADAFGHGYWAYGCLEDWQDTKLGQHAAALEAERAVEEWVHEHES